ncbi:flagellar hook-associated protein FlgK [Sporosarcina sp. FSL K6-2383]|uniref:flagellar hook-associated protein FlgK n=1 Tax=Sporosarcina sp. FSL K6-2383 TaxID=2921556 RepID=UPI003159A17B
MRSSFMGLETSKRGLFTQQSALYTTGHNISNANTLGYSRQRVNMEATAGYPGIGLNSGTMPGFLGTGVQAGSIQRIRDSFVDHQYRQESTKLGYWDTTSKAISQMEDVLNEPSQYGLQKSLSEFWASLQTLSTNPENSGARAVAVQRGVAVADSFNYMHKSLTDIQTNLGKEIGITTKDVNSILQQIAEINEQITKVEPNGYLPNDLYDARDALIDELSAIVPIETSYTKSGGRALAIAEGSVTIKIKSNGTPSTITVVDGKDYSTMSVTLPDAEGNPDGPVTGFTFSTVGTATGGPLIVSEMVNSGKMKSLVDSFGYADGSPEGKGLYPDMIRELNRMAEVFAQEFNAIHEGGYDANGTLGEAFFVEKGTTTPPGNINAGNIYVNQDLLDDPSKLAAADAALGAGEVGNGKNALALSNMQFTNFLGAGNTGLDGATVQSFFQGLIGKLGVDGQQAERLAFNTATLLGAVEHRRASISSVSLDEEMTDMIRFQQAYNASARMITVVDETLDKIINGMGVVGR